MRLDPVAGLLVSMEVLGEWIRRCVVFNRSANRRLPVLPTCRVGVQVLLEQNQPHVWLVLKRHIFLGHVESSTKCVVKGQGLRQGSVTHLDSLPLGAFPGAHRRPDHQRHVRTSAPALGRDTSATVSYTHLRAHETDSYLV